MDKNYHQPAHRSRKEYPFIPRIINPVKIKDVIIFSAEEAIRQSQKIIQTEMPWTQVQVLVSPMAVSQISSENAKVMILDDAAMNFVDVEKIRQNNKDAVIVLVSYNRLIQCSPPNIARKEFPYTAKADLVFAVDRYNLAPEKIITSIVRSAEDYLNIEKRSGARRFILLIVDDEPSWPSQFLPILYKIIGQRACVKITRTYEETLRFIFGVDNEAEIAKNYRECGSGDQVVCLITDIFFPKSENINSDAGKALIKLVNKYYARIPIVIASKAKEAAELASAGFVMPKGDPGSLEMLSNFIHDFTGMGDFVVQDENDKELYRLKDLGEMCSLLLKAKEAGQEAERLRSILESYGAKDKFSTWFYMHSLRELGDRLRPQKHKGIRMINLLRKSLKEEIMRMQYTPLIMGGIKIFNLLQLLDILRVIPPDTLAPFSDNDIISSWLDQKGYFELAEELRPIHGTGLDLRKAIVEIVEAWISIYQKRATPFFI